MKKTTILCALAAIAMGAQLVMSSNANTIPASDANDTIWLEKNRPISGMFFSTDNVVEQYEYDDAYCIVYDDPDANMFEVEICVDLDTYRMCLGCVKSGKHIVGELVRNEQLSDCDIEVYTYAPDPEFEMADASSKF